MNVEQEIRTLKNKIGSLGQGKRWDIKGGMNERRDISENSSADEIKIAFATLIRDLKSLGVLK